MNPEWDAFISYSSTDRKIVDQVVEDLERAGLRIWYDTTKLNLSDRVRESIVNAIENSAATLVFISTRSVGSRWVLNELDTAMLREINEKRVSVIPILIGKVSVDDIPGDLRGKRYLDLRHNFARRYSALRMLLVTAVREIAKSARGGADEGQGYPLGDDFVSYILSYSARIRKERGEAPTDELVPSYEPDSVDSLARLFLFKMMDVLDEAQEDPSEYKAARDEFTVRYGTLSLERALATLLRSHGVGSDGVFSLEQIEEPLLDIHTLPLMFGFLKHGIRFTARFHRNSIAYKIDLQSVPQHVLDDLREE